MQVYACKESIIKRGPLSWLLHKKGSLNTNFNSERNFANVSTRCSSLQGKSEVNVKTYIMYVAGVLTLTSLSA